MQRAEYTHPGLRPTEFRGSTLRTPIVLSCGFLRLTLEPEGSVSSLYSGKELRLLVGKASVHLYKVQAGVRVPARREDSTLTVAPFAATLKTRAFGSVDVFQSVRLHSGDSVGYVRTLQLTNMSRDAIRVIVLTLNDPTAVHSGSTGVAGAIGVNAFNRGDHVAMDEVGDSTAARVVGARPAPRTIFMTRDIGRTSELLQHGDLPGSTAGMTGQLMIMTLHEVELQPSESSEIVFVSAYHDSRLEDAVSTFSSLVQNTSLIQTPAQRTSLLSASQALTKAFLWSSASMQSLDSHSDLLNRLDSLPGSWVISPSVSLGVLNQAKKLLSKKGFLPHASNSSIEGILESSLFVLYGSRFLRIASDRKLTKTLYAPLRRCAIYLAKKSADGLVIGDPSLPNGWRRRLVIGFPSGATTEVNLTVAGALKEFSSLARQSGKGAEAAKFREASDRLLSMVRSTLLDHETGVLALNLDPRGRVHRDDTVDQAVGLYRIPYDANICGSAVHRLLEKDFETGYGPRTVPSSNEVYFNGSYMDGQLGGFWTSAALAVAVLAFTTGFPTIGSRVLSNCAKLVDQDALKMGSPPGTIPEWTDIEYGRMHGEGTDAVAASRFIECIVTGELGISLGEAGVEYNPPASTETKWLLLLNAWFGEEATTLIVRKSNRALVLTTAKKASTVNCLRMGRFENVEVSSSDLVAGQFVDPGQVVCVLNPTSFPHSCSVSFSLRDPSIAKHLSTELQEFDPLAGEWVTVERAKVLPKMQLQTTVGALGWRIVRLAPP